MLVTVYPTVLDYAIVAVRWPGAFFTMARSVLYDGPERSERSLQWVGAFFTTARSVLYDNNVFSNLLNFSMLNFSFGVLKFQQVSAEC